LKRTCLFVVVSLFVLTCLGQSSFSVHDTLFQVFGPYDGPNISGYVTITNVSNHSLDLICRISSANMTVGHTKWFCFGPICYPPTTTVSIVTSVNAGDTAQLIAYCAPNDSEGVSVVNYEVFDVNGNSDTISFSFAYSFTVAGIDKLFSTKYILNVSPNPASDFTEINCNVNLGKTNLMLLQANSGILIKEIRIEAKDKPFILPVSDFATGLYSCILLIDGEPAAVTNLLIEH
jgi:hypothetical protein